MSAKCWLCDGTGRVAALSGPVSAYGPTDEICANCYGTGETGRCEICGEDEIDGGVCNYCGHVESDTDQREAK